MLKGLIIYEEKDYIKNTWFAQRLITCAQEQGAELTLMLTKNLLLGYDQDGIFAAHQSENIIMSKLIKYDFIINRSRDSFISKQFELMGTRSFNNSEVIDICNDKLKTHQLINSKGIPSVNSLFMNKNSLNTSGHKLSFPLIVKNPSGHGGTEVFMAENNDQLIEIVDSFSTQSFLIQEVCSTPGVDIRVFVIGNTIKACVKRSSVTSFLSNYSLGGNTQRYVLTSEQQQLVLRIMSILKFDFVGIDFILGENNTFLFNEIEDAVGCRSVYKHYDIDIASDYIQYVLNRLQ